MGVFFVSWAMWEKLTFCLACAMALTISAGIAKNYWSARKRRLHYETVNVDALADASTVPAMVERRKVRDEEEAEAESETKDKDEIPFGIRALEKGIEVEGVWVSRSNTPAPSSAGNSLYSMTPPGGRSRSSSMDITSARPQIALPNDHQDAPHGYGRPRRSGARSIRGGSPARNSLLEKVAHAERTMLAGNSVHGAGYPHNPTDQPPSPASTRSDSSFTETTSVNTLDILNLNTMGTTTKLMYEQTRHKITKDWSSGSHASADSIDSIKAVVTEDTGSNHMREISVQNRAYLTTRPITNDKLGQFDLLQSHRLSHVAETGQLTPRIRSRPGTSGDWANVNGSRPPNSRTSSDEVTSKEDKEATPTPTPPSPFDVAPQRHSPPKLQIPIADYFERPSSEETDSTPITPHFPKQELNAAADTRFISFNNIDIGPLTTLQQSHTRPVTFPDLSLSIPPEAHHEIRPATLYQAQEPSPFSHQQPERRSVTSPHLRQPSPQQTFSVPPNDAQVLRKVNSGFEIMRPGTFGTPPTPLADNPNMGNARRSKEVTRLSFTGGRRDSKEHKKLQKKKRRPSADSQRRSSSIVR